MEREKGKGGEGERVANASLCKTQIGSAALDAWRACCARVPPSPPPPPEDLPGAQAVSRARLHDPLIGRAGPLVKLFCLSGQRIKAAAAALGTALPQFSYPLPGCPAKQLGRATPGRLVAEEPLVLFPCVAAEICKRDPSSKTAEHPLPTSRAQVKKSGLRDCLAREGRKKCRLDWAAPISENRSPAKLNPRLNSMRQVAELF
ncbi:uncharacterized protein LOC133752621 [Lepus europaeus]|uniref:uncharacterized protein LOC133752621 n=1 Tax=Lepus europaeus TaxID=9983 RepID=UPI002B48CD5A|nr:uncharacterized protein LOC133752621 [Lepus europaeus]